MFAEASFAAVYHMIQVRRQAASLEQNLAEHGFHLSAEERATIRTTLDKKYETRFIFSAAAKDAISKATKQYKQLLNEEG